MQIKKTFSLNLAGALGPAFIAVMGIGLLARKMAPSDFGFYLIAISITNYFLIVDLGLSSSLIRYFGKAVSIGQKVAAAKYVFRTAIKSALFATILLWALCKTIVKYSGDGVTESHELYLSMLIISAGLPALVLTNTGNSLLEASGKLKLLIVNRVTQAIFSTLIPGLISIYYQDLTVISITYTVGRFLSTIILYRKYLYRLLFKLKSNKKIEYKELHAFGGWTAVSNIVSPLMTSMDKIIIGSILGSSLAGTYGLATELMNKLMIVPQATCRIILQLGEKKIKKENKINDIKKYLNYFSLIIGAIVFFMANTLVRFWVGENQQLSILIKILIIGFILNSATQFYYNKMMAFGMARSLAIIHLIELPIFFVALYIFTNKYGLFGSGAAWVGRMFLDYIMIKIQVKYEKN